MKKTITFLFILSLFSSDICFSQSGWFWQNPLPTGSNLTDAFFLNNLTAFAVGWNGSVIKTSNSGSNWVPIYSNLDVKLYSLYFITENTGFAVSGDLDAYPDGILYKTNSGGENWFSINSFTRTHLNKIIFMDDNTGFIAGAYNQYNGRIFRTSNSGSNWTQCYSNNYCAINGICFVDDLKGYACGDCGTVLKTINGGINWSLSNNGISSSNLQSISFPDSLNGFVVGFGGIIYKTTNEGTTWNRINMNTTSYFRDAKFLNRDTGFVICGGYYYYNYTQGSIFKTTNSGVSWDSTYISNNIRRFAISNNHFIVVGNSGTIFRSDDYGGTWINSTSKITAANLSSVYFVDAFTGYVVGSSGLILKTINQGNNWSPLSSGSGVNLSSCFFLNPSVGLVAGDSGRIIRTSNAGSTWDLLNVGTTTPLYQISLINNIGYVCGGYSNIYGGGGVVYKSSNSGTNWVTIYQATGYGNLTVSGISFLNENTGFLCGVPDRVLKTTNGGLSWNSIPTNVNHCTHMQIKFLNEQTGFLVGYSSTYNYYSFFKTTNGGINWTNINFPAPNGNNQFISVSFAGPCGYVIQRNFDSYYNGSDIFVTNNSGQVWQRYSAPSNYRTLYGSSLNNICAISDSVAIAVGTNGTIIRLNRNLMTIGVGNISNIYPLSFSLSQNYPNPFNPVTRIKYDVPSNVKSEKSNVKIIVYDILGREIETLVNESQKPGSYEVSWDGSRCASGVYFYRLYIDDASTPLSITKKMVLIK